MAETIPTKKQHGVTIPHIARQHLTYWVGSGVGAAVGDTVGAGVGAGVGETVGSAVGFRVGESVLQKINYPTRESENVDQQDN